MKDGKATIAVLVSGGGTNLQAILDAEKSGIIKNGAVTLVISNNPGAYALKRAQAAGVETAVVDKKNCATNEEFERRVIELIDRDNTDLIVLAGFMCILSEAFTSRYPERIINIHPSLIPKHCGKGYYGLKVHESVLAAGDKVSGATVHFVNEIPDGGRIIAQREVPVLKGDTPEALQRRVMEQAEWILLPEAIEKACLEIVTGRDLI